jgi:hypothetical protein
MITMIGRGSPSGKPLNVTPNLPGDGSPALGTLASQVVADGASAMNLQYQVQAKTSAIIQTFGKIKAGSGTTSGKLKCTFAPDGGGPTVVLRERSFTVGTADSEFRLLPQVVEIPEKGVVGFLWENIPGGSTLTITNSDAAVQPIHVTT